MASSLWSLYCPLKLGHISLPRCWYFFSLHFISFYGKLIAFSRISQFSSFTTLQIFSTFTSDLCTSESIQTAIAFLFITCCCPSMAPVRDQPVYLLSESALASIFGSFISSCSALISFNEFIFLKTLCFLYPGFKFITKLYFCFFIRILFHHQLSTKMFLWHISLFGNCLNWHYFIQSLINSLKIISSLNFLSIK